MRKQNVFGKKVSRTKAIYLIVFIFILVVSTHFILVDIQERKLEELQAQELVLQQQIDVLLESNQSVTYHDIGGMIQFLPNYYDQLSIINEINFVRNLAGLALATNYHLVFGEDSQSPFEEDLPESIIFTKIQISMVIDSPDLILDFMDHLLEQERLYYIDELTTTYMVDGGAMISMTVYTFHNDVEI